MEPNLKRTWRENAHKNPYRKNRTANLIQHQHTNKKRIGLVSILFECIRSNHCAKCDWHFSNCIFAFLRAIGWAQANEHVSASLSILNKWRALVMCVCVCVAIFNNSFHDVYIFNLCALCNRSVCATPHKKNKINCKNVPCYNIHDNRCYEIVTWNLRGG